MYKQILIVDDDICLAYAIQSYLSSHERKIFIVDNFNSAIQLLKLYSFDLVISDIMMPIMDGYKFLTHLRSDCDLCYIPVIFLTAKGMTADRIKGYDLGCNAYLTKPFHPSELLSIINNIFNHLNSLKDAKGMSLLQNSKIDQLLGSQNCIWDFTSREISVLRLLVQGMMNKEIASSLNLGIRNVEKYVGRLLSKTKTRNRTELAQLSWFISSRANDGTRTRE
uniref:hypothetical protein n=1 Tax=Lithothamnion corallioides TaxID=1277934 RepID=UPI0023F510A1|nr:hypothetical protein P6G75_pgp135 [Lithothamnion corallioides]WEA77119.1 hypothetical protein [Lithothamnion corallioides]